MLHLLYPLGDMYSKLFKTGLVYIDSLHWRAYDALICLPDFFNVRDKSASAIALHILSSTTLDSFCHLLDLYLVNSC